MTIKQQLIGNIGRRKEIQKRREELDAEIRKRLKSIPELSYQTRSVLFDLNGTNLVATDMLIASLMTKTNILLIGYQGKVKTELAKYVRDEWFGGQAAFLRGRKNLDTAAAFLDLRLDLARSSAKSDKDIVEVNEASKYQLIIVDELNRIPEVVQQEIFPISDGHVEKDGRVYYLGKQINDDPTQRYVVIIASANIGEAFKGTFEIDRALLDRYTILDLDMYPTDGTSYMAYMMFGAQRGKSTAGFADIYPLFEEYYRLLMSEPTYGFHIALLAEFLRSGLTYCTRDKTSKSNIEMKIRRSEFCHGCHSSPIGCNHIPLTFERGVEYSTKLFIALDLLVRSRTDESQLSVDSIPMGMAKVHAFRLGPVMKITHQMDQIMVNDVTMQPATIVTAISKFIVDEINSAKEKVAELMVEANKIVAGKQKQFTPELEAWFKNSRWIGAFEGIKGIVEAMTK